MLGTLLLLAFIRLFFKLHHNLRNFLLVDISNGMPCLLYLSGLTLDLRPRDLTNPFPDPPKLSFYSEDVIFILSRLSNFNEMSKVTYLSLLLISLCFLTLR